MQPGERVWARGTLLRIWIAIWAVCVSRLGTSGEANGCVFRFFLSKFECVGGDSFRVGVRTASEIKRLVLWNLD